VGKGRICNALTLEMFRSSAPLGLPMGGHVLKNEPIKYCHLRFASNEHSKSVTSTAIYNAHFISSFSSLSKTTMSSELHYDNNYKL